MLQALQQRRDSLSEVKQLIAEAAREADLMQPVASRKARRAAAEVRARGVGLGAACVQWCSLLCHFAELSTAAAIPAEGS